MATNIQVGEVGFAFRITLNDADGVAVDLSTSTAVNIVFLRPDGDRLVVDADFQTDGTDGKIEYLTQVGDLNLAGGWKMQVSVSYPSNGLLISDISKFKVGAVI